MEELGGAFFVVLVSLVLSAEVVGVGYEVIDSTLLCLGFGRCQRPVVDCDQPAKGTVGCFDDVLFPEVIAGASRALLGDVEVVWFYFSSGDFIRGHLLDQAGFLSECGGGEQRECGGESCQLRTANVCCGPGSGDLTPSICFHRGAVGTECQFAMLAAFYDCGFVRDQLALTSERLDLSELAAGGSFGECCGDGGGNAAGSTCSSISRMSPSGLKVTSLLPLGVISSIS